MAFLVTLLPRTLAATLAILSLVAAPTTIHAQAVPPYAQPAAPSQEQTIHGRIASVDTAFHLTLRDDRGYLDSVSLHQDTIVNPRGLTLAPGMNVTILGFPASSTFVANQIDTPYGYSGPVPTPVYYGTGWWYPGFAYGYGPAFTVRLNFFHGGYRFVRGPFYGHPIYYSPFGLYGTGGSAIGFGYYGGGYYGGGYYGGGYYGAPYYNGPYYYRRGYYGAPYYRGGHYYGGPYRGGYYGGTYYGGKYYGGTYQGGGYHGAGMYRAGGVRVRGGR
jgi:hypothetical protein